MEILLDSFWEGSTWTVTLTNHADLWYLIRKRRLSRYFQTTTRKHRVKWEIRMYSCVVSATGQLQLRRVIWQNVCPTTCAVSGPLRSVPEAPLCSGRNAHRIYFWRKRRGADCVTSRAKSWKRIGSVLKINTSLQRVRILSLMRAYGNEDTVTEAQKSRRRERKSQNPASKQMFRAAAQTQLVGTEAARVASPTCICWKFDYSSITTALYV